MSSPVEHAPDDSNLTAMAELRVRADALEQQLTELQRHTETRLAHAELKAEALRAGMIDLDGLRLLDIPALKLNDKGEVEGAAALMQGLRKNKPWLFTGSGQSSSNPASPPAALQQRQKMATEMSDAEYRIARAALLKQRL